MAGSKGLDSGQVLQVEAAGWVHDLVREVAELGEEFSDLLSAEAMLSEAPDGLADAWVVAGEHDVEFNLVVGLGLSDQALHVVVDQLLGQARAKSPRDEAVEADSDVDEGDAQE